MPNRILVIPFSVVLAAALNSSELTLGKGPQGSSSGGQTSGFGQNNGPAAGSHSGGVGHDSFSGGSNFSGRPAAGAANPAGAHFVGGPSQSNHFVGVSNAPIGANAVRVGVGGNSPAGSPSGAMRSPQAAGGPSLQFGAIGGPANGSTFSGKTSKNSPTVVARPQASDTARIQSIGSLGNSLTPESRSGVPFAFKKSGDSSARNTASDSANLRPSNAPTAGGNTGMPVGGDVSQFGRSNAGRSVNVRKYDSGLQVVSIGGNSAPVAAVARGQSFVARHPMAQLPTSSNQLSIVSGSASSGQSAANIRHGNQGNDWNAHGSSGHHSGKGQGAGSNATITRLSLSNGGLYSSVGVGSNYGGGFGYVGGYMPFVGVGYFGLGSYGYFPGYFPGYYGGGYNQMGFSSYFSGLGFGSWGPNGYFPQTYAAYDPYGILGGGFGSNGYFPRGYYAYDPYGYGYGYGGGWGNGLPDGMYGPVENVGYATGSYARGVASPATLALAAAGPSAAPSAVAPVPEPGAPATNANGDTTKEVESFADKGEAAFRARDYEGAVNAWRHAAIDDPQNGLVVMLLGESLFATGKYEEAAGATQAAMQLLPRGEWGVVVSNAQELYGKFQDYTTHLRALESAVKSQPEAPALRFLVAFHYAYLGFPRDAVAQLDKTLKLAPQDQAAKALRDEMRAKLPAKPAAPATPESP